jgi:hypothetical protein
MMRRVLEQQGAMEVLHKVLSVLQDTGICAIGCNAGRHRSVALGAVAADWSHRLLGNTHIFHLHETENLHEARTMLRTAYAFCGRPSEMCKAWK